MNMDLQITWDEENYSVFIEFLKSFADLKYLEFNSKIVNDDSIKYIGVRTPELRKIAKVIAKNDYRGFIRYNKHYFYEERLLHGFVIGYAKIDYTVLMQEIKNFIPYLSNWALVDMFAAKFKQIQNNKNEALKEIINFTKSANPWEVRLGLIILLVLYVEKNYIDKILKICLSIENEHYYVKMGNAWLVAECYIKFPKETTKLLESKLLNTWVHNKAIQKIRESLRVENDDKEFLNTLKIKGSTKPLPSMKKCTPALVGH